MVTMHFQFQGGEFDSRFSILDMIRGGSQGCVMPISRNGEKIALKIIDYSTRKNTNKAITDLKREYTSLQFLNHPSIIKFLSFDHDQANQRAFLHMEWAGSELAESPGGAVDLADIIGRRQVRDGQPTPDYLPESFIWHVLFHLGAALALCHHGIELRRMKFSEEVDSTAILSQLSGQSSHPLKSLAIKHPTIRWITERIVFSAREFHEPIIHRDIKPRNILLCDPPREPSTQVWRSDGDISLKDAIYGIYPIVLLGDFGFSAPLRDAQTRGIGTIGYAAPEVPLEPSRPGSGPFEWKTGCDIYSLGVTILHLMTLKSLPEYAVNSTAYPPFPSVYSERLKQLVSRCHHSDPSQRATAIEVLNACIGQHRWDQTYISPYGVPITANFTAAMTRSWNKCVQAMAPVENFDINPRPISPSLGAACNLGRSGACAGSPQSSDLSLFRLKKLGSVNIVGEEEEHWNRPKECGSAQDDIHPSPGSDCSVFDVSNTEDEQACDEATDSVSSEPDPDMSWHLVARIPCRSEKHEA